MYSKVLDNSLVRRNVGYFDNNPSITFKPHEKWRETLLEPSFIHLIFRVSFISDKDVCDNVKL